MREYEKGKNYSALGRTGEKCPKCFDSEIIHFAPNHNNSGWYTCDGSNCDYYSSYATWFSKALNLSGVTEFKIIKKELEDNRYYLTHGSFNMYIELIDNNKFYIVSEYINSIDRQTYTIKNEVKSYVVWGIIFNKPLPHR